MSKIKLVLLSLVMSLIISVGYSQTVNGVLLKDIDVEFVQIVGTGKLFKNEVTIEIDFGQKDKIWSNKDTRILDIDGKDVVLNSMIDALNFMHNNGYVFVTAYAVTIGNQNVYHYLLRKV